MDEIVKVAILCGKAYCVTLVACLVLSVPFIAISIMLNPQSFSFAIGLCTASFIAATLLTPEAEPDPVPVAPAENSKNGKGKGKKVSKGYRPAPVEAVAPVPQPVQSSGMGFGDYLMLSWLFNSGSRTETVVVHDRVDASPSVDTPEMPHDHVTHEFTSPDPTPVPDTTDFSSGFDSSSSFDSGSSDSGSFDSGGGGSFD